MSKRMLRSWKMLTLVGFLGTTGCSFGPAKPSELKNLASVSGSISFRGEAPVGAVLTLIPEQTDRENTKAIASIATVGPEGKFVVQTIAPAGVAKGAPPGNYEISVSWTKPLRPDDRDSDRTPELLPAKFQNTKTSGLKAVVKPGTNQWEPLVLNP